MYVVYTCTQDGVGRTIAACSMVSLSSSGPIASRLESIRLLMLLSSTLVGTIGVAINSYAAKQRA